jgi:hypothetical protein
MIEKTTDGGGPKEKLLVRDQNWLMKCSLKQVHRSIYIRQTIYGKRAEVLRKTS